MRCFIQGKLTSDHLWISWNSASYIVVLFFWSCVSWKKMVARSRPLEWTRKKADHCRKLLFSLVYLSFSNKGKYSFVIKIFLLAFGSIWFSRKLFYRVHCWNSINPFLQVAQKLIEAGADLNSPNAHKLVPLHLTAQNGHLELSKILVQAGADLDRQDLIGKFFWFF